MNGNENDIRRFTGLIDRHGPAFGTWPDAAEAQWARQLVLAAPEARRVRDEAMRLDDLLAAHAARLDAELDPGAIERIAGHVLNALPKRVPEVRYWMSRMAAGFLVAAAFGGLFEGYTSYSTSEADDIYLVEALVLGPAEVEMP